MVSFPKPPTIPIIPLQKDSHLLPGIVLRLPLASRPDVPSLLTNVYSLSKSGARIDAKSIVIGCVPVRSPLLTKDGRRMIGDGSDSPGHEELSRRAVDADKARKDDLYGYGTLARIIAIENRGTKEVSIVVEGLSRFKINSFVTEKPYIQANVTYIEEQPFREDDVVMRDLFGQLKNLAGELLTLLRLSSLFPKQSNIAISPLLARRLEQYIAKRTVREAGLLADFMSNLVESSFEDKLIILSAWDVKERVEKAIELISRQITAIKGNLKVTSLTTATLPISIDKLQFNRNNDQLARNLLGGPRNSNPFGGNGDGDDEDGNELEDLKKKLDAAGLSEEAEKVAQRELKRLKKMNPAQAEYQVCRNYLEVLSELPWNRMTDDHFTPETLTRARKQLDDDHYGLETIKKRLLEYLAVLKLKQQINTNLDKEIARITKENTTSSEDAEKEDNAAADAKIQILQGKRVGDKSPILLLVGPPGTGKTSLAKSIATALDRKFHRISLGGVRDEAEIRGHRRTYVAAMPGIIVNGLKKVGVSNPVFLLDEIDKIGGANFQGDPSAAMLEVLDPEQNGTFVDHFVNIPIDLSRVLFIATANSLDTIPGPLLDRMETITLSGYTTLEKRHIAAQHLVPKQTAVNGLEPGQIILSEDVIDKIATGYTREAGVRNLEREIGSVCRFKAVEYADAVDASKSTEYNPKVAVEDLDTILGIEKFEDEIAEQTSRPGIVTGLVAYGGGGNGGILFIEMAEMPGSGRVQLTGKLGEVLKESVEVALTWVKAHAFELGLAHDLHTDIMKLRNIHVHCPSGAIPKDGPSAGMAHTIALISLFSNNPVRPTLAMTGEMSLRGRVLPVGGIKEKLIGALRAGVKTVLIPAANKKNLRDLPAEVIEGLEIIPVRHISEAMKHVWPESHWPGEQLLGVESRL